MSDQPSRRAAHAEPEEPTPGDEPRRAAAGANPAADAVTEPPTAIPEPIGPISQTLAHTESAEARGHRITTGILLAVVGVLLVALVFITHGNAQFALSDALDVVRLPTITVPGIPTVLICGLLCLAAAFGYLSGRVPGRWRGVGGGVAGLAVVVGFVAWAAAGRSLPFLVTNQLNGTIAYATPLILGGLAGVMGERSGVVNVAIEGQFLSAAFTSCVVGSITGSIPVALIAGMIAGLLVGALLALFTVNYLVDQVVLGVVLNLLVSGLTGFLYSQFVAPNPLRYNSAPVMEKISIPLLSKIPFLGPVLFQQRGLAYLAVIAVVVVWFLLYHTKWGLRVRSVGEHPEAADTVGISVRAVRWQAVLVGGLLAGLGGCFFTLGATGQFTKDISAGNGFIALAALIMGRWRPLPVALMALFFGFVSQLASQMQTLNTPLPSQFLLLLPYVATVVAVAGLVGRVRGPAADGVNYVK